MTEFLGELVNKIIQLLPLDPFIDSINSIDVSNFGILPYILNISAIVKITLAWVTCIGLFYLYMAIARWVKLID